MMRVLVAEDDLTSRTILVALLKKWGYDPLAVPDGEDAWQVMAREDAPMLAILDWRMPGMDGVEICQRVRKRHAANPPYLILLTAKGDKADIVQGLEAGANDYVSKPYDSSELRARLEVGRRMVALQSELIAAKNALAHEAMHDPLTGAPNRRAILDALEKELMRKKRKTSTVSIGLCDIDHFKKVNDTYGHQAGDEVLQGFVKIVQKCLRGYDMLGRLGGEEFLVVAPDSRGMPEEGLYERLRGEVASRKIPTKMGDIPITVSIGVAAGDNGHTADSLLAAADAALYRAKAEGRNRVVYAGVRGEGG